MNAEKVLNLAKLARIEMNDAEAEKLSGEFEQILNYVSEVKKVPPLDKGEIKEGIYNVFREDGEPHESGIYTEKILSQASAREGNYLKVKKIL